MNIPFEIETARSAVHFVLSMVAVIGLGLWSAYKNDKSDKE